MRDKRISEVWEWLVVIFILIVAVIIVLSSCGASSPKGVDYDGFTINPDGTRTKCHGTTLIIEDGAHDNITAVPNSSDCGGTQ